jgi:co-chaperonin GroES (HSP10)
MSDRKIKLVDVPATTAKKPDFSVLSGDLGLAASVLNGMERFYLLIRQAEVKKQIGKILLADETISGQEWNHGLAEVIMVGPAAFKGQRFADMGLTGDDAPKVGDYIIFQSRAPYRFKIDGQLYLIIADDGFLARVKRDQAHRIAFQVG